MRAVSALTAMLLVGLAGPVVGQAATPCPAAKFPSDPITGQYGGVINVMAAGDGGYEAIAAFVECGKVLCMVSIDGRRATGPGLLQISLGLIPDAPSPVPGGTREYSVSVACPQPMEGLTLEARWSHSYDSYQVPGGEVRSADGRPVLPEKLENGFNENVEGGSLTMSWKLCLGCKPPPPTPPAAPPP